MGPKELDTTEHLTKFIYVESKKIKATNELTYKNRNRLIDVENKLIVTRE